MAMSQSSKSIWACCEGIASTSTSSRAPVARQTHRSSPPPISSVQPHSTRYFSTTTRRTARVQDHYQSLKLPKNASKQQIKAKFYELSKKTHPDAPGGSAEKFHEINEAYETLGDAKKKREYDLEQSSPPSSSSQSNYNYNPGPYYSPTSDPFRRNSSSQQSWSTRRPPPKGPSTGYNPYSPFGRHTPPNYSGGSSGSYGDPYAHVRDQFRQGFADVRSGKAWSFQHPSASARPRESPGGGEGTPGKKEEVESGVWGRIVGICALLIVVLSFGGTMTTVRAEDADTSSTNEPPGWREMQDGFRRDDALAWRRYEHWVKMGRPREQYYDDTLRKGVTSSRVILEDMERLQHEAKQIQPPEVNNQDR